MNACYLPNRESETDPARTLGVADGLGLASGGGGHVDVIELADPPTRRVLPVRRNQGGTKYVRMTGAAPVHGES